MRASNRRIRRKPDVQSRSETDVGEFVGVPIVQFDLDPTIFDGLVQPALEIGIPHIEKIIASKHAARSNSVLHKNAEDLASYIFIRCHVMCPLPVSKRRSHRLNTAASRASLYILPSAPMGDRMRRRRNNLIDDAVVSR